MKNMAPDISPAGELQTLMASRVALVVIESREEARVIERVREAAMKAQRGRNWGVFQWTVTEGLLRVDVDMGGAQKTLSEPEQLLKHIRATHMAGIYVLLDFHPYLVDRPLFVRAIKDIAQDYARSEEHTSELQSRRDLVCRLLLEKKKKDHHERRGRATRSSRRRRAIF